MKTVDGFGESFAMKVDGKRDLIHSWMGTLCTIMMALLLAGFTYLKTLNIINKKDITILSTEIEGAYDYDYKFTADSGFFVAAALTAFDSGTEILEEPQYGELVIKHYGWSNNEGELGSYSTPIGNHYCSDQELGITASPLQQLTFPVVKDITEVTNWKKKFKCVDRESLVIWGDYNSNKAQQLAV